MRHFGIINLSTLKITEFHFGEKLNIGNLDIAISLAG